MALDIPVIREQEVAVVAPAGAVDTRSSAELEKTLLGLAEQRVTRVVVDLAGVTLLTSAGIRVLVMLGKRVRLADGELVLCGLNEHVQSVFEVSGLLPLFSIVTDRAAALAALAPKAARAASSSPLAKVTLRLLGFGAAHPPAPSTDRALPQGLAGQVAALLERADRRVSS